MVARWQSYLVRGIMIRNSKPSYGYRLLCVSKLHSGDVYVDCGTQ